MTMYETIFIAEPGLAEPEAESLAETFQKVVTDGKGSVLKADGWGKKKLAYALRKHQEGYYYHIRYDAPSEVVTELERRLRIHEQVLRYLSVRLTREALQAVEVAEKKASEKAAARAAREAERAARQAEAMAGAESSSEQEKGPPPQGEAAGRAATETNREELASAGSEPAKPES